MPNYHLVITGSYSSVWWMWTRSCLEKAIFSRL